MEEVLTLFNGVGYSGQTLKEVEGGREGRGKRGRGSGREGGREAKEGE